MGQPKPGVLLHDPYSQNYEHIYRKKMLVYVVWFIVYNLWFIVYSLQFTLYSIFVTEIKF